MDGMHTYEQKYLKQNLGSNLGSKLVSLHRRPLSALFDAQGT